MKKRILLMLLAFAMVLSIMPAITLPTEAADVTEHTNHDGWTEITADMGGFEEGNYVLNNNITFTSTDSHSVTGTVTICLNGHTLDVSSACIEVDGYGVLNICDCADTKGKLFTDGSGYALDIGEATVNLENCVVEIEANEAAVLSAISMMFDSTLNCINSSVLVAEGSGEAVNSIYANTGRVNVSGSTISRIYLYDTSSVYLAGKNTIDVIQFCNDKSLGQIYVTEKPSEGSSIGLVFHSDATFPFYAVQGTDTYTLTDADTACFQVRDNSSYQVTNEYDVVRKGNALAAFAAAQEPYVVVVNETSNGTVTSDVELGVENTEVTLTVSPDEGYVLDKLTVTDVNNTPVTVDNNTFTMPNADVTVNATFKKAVFDVKVSAVDIAGGSELAGAKIQIIDSQDSVKAEWTSTRGVYTVTDLESGIYTLRATAAPDGYALTTDTTFYIAADGTVTTDGSQEDDTGTLLVEFAKTKVVIEVVDADTDEALIRAYVKILDNDETEYASWYSSEEPYEKEELTVGSYIIRVKAPEGYEPASSDITFTIDEYGKIESAAAGADGTITVELKAKTYNITPEPCTGGSVEPNKYSAKVGEQITITAKPFDGYELNYFSVYPPVEGTQNGNQYTFSMPADNIFISASFNPINYTVTLTGNTTYIKNASDFNNKTANYKDTITIQVADVPFGYKPSFSGADVTSPEGSVNGDYTFKMPAENVTITASLVDALTHVKDDLYTDGEDYYQKDGDSGEFIPVHVHTAEVNGEIEYTVFTPFFDMVDSINGFDKYYPAGGNYYIEDNKEYNQSFYFGRDYYNNYSPDNVVLCMNGKTWNDTATSAKVGLFVVDKDSSLTVIDCTGEGKINSNRPTGSVFQMYGATSSLTVKDITVTNTGGYGVQVASNDVSVELENVTVNITGGDNYSSAIFAGGNRKNDTPIAYSDVEFKIIGGEFTVTNQYANALSFRDDGTAASTSSAIDVDDAKFKGNISLQTKILNAGKITLEDCDITGSVEVYAGAATLHGGKVDGWVSLQRIYGETVPSKLLLSSEPEITKSIYVYNSDRNGASVHNKQYLIIADDMSSCGPYSVDLLNQRDSGYEFLFAEPDAEHINLSRYEDNFTTPYNYTVRHNEDDGNLYVYIYPYISDKDGDNKYEVDSNDDGIYEGSKDTNGDGSDNLYLPDGNGGYIEVNPDTDGDGVYEDDEGNRYIPVDTTEPADGKYDDVIIDAADPETEKGDGIFEDDESNTYVPDGDDSDDTPDKIIDNGDGTYSEDVNGDDVIDDSDESGSTYIPDQDGDEEAEKVEKNPDGSLTDKGEEGDEDVIYVPVKGENGETEFVPVEKNEDEDGNHDGTYTDKDGNTYIPDGEGGFTKVEKDDGGSGSDDEEDYTPVHKCPSKQFDDLNTDNWYHGAIDFVLDNGLMEGVGGNKFAPGMNLSRAMIVRILYNREGKPEYTTEKSFSDVPEGQWYTDAVLWGAENGIVEGYNGAFSPNDDITREQMATILYRYAQFKGVDVSVRGDLEKFRDGENTSLWALEEMQWAVGVGLIDGKGDSILDPTGTATRAEVAQIFKNFNDKVLAK